jgi:hypothetical protein
VNATVAFSATILLAGIFLQLTSPLPPDAPVELHGESAPYVFEFMPPPETNLELLVRSWQSPLEFSEFLDRYSKYVTASSAMGFVGSYRRSLVDLQRTKWEGDCNDFAYAVCEVGARHGYKMGFVSMWPKDWGRLFAEDWHQVAVLCLREDERYVVFDNGTPRFWEGTLEDYADSVGKKIVPFGGQLNWRPTRDNPIARFVDQFRCNERLSENTRPIHRLNSRGQML